MEHSITIYNVTDRVPEHDEDIWVLKRQTAWRPTAPSIPERIRKGHVVYKHMHNNIKYNKDYYEIELQAKQMQTNEPLEKYFKGDFTHYLLHSELEIFLSTEN